MRKALLCLMVAASCGGGNVGTSDAIVSDTASDSGPDPNDGAKSGSRLKLMWYEFADGTRQLSGTYDALRKEPCFIYSDWADGNTYCAPDYGGSIVYSAAGCTAKVAQVYRDPSCTQPPPTYLLEYAASACDYRPAHLYTRGAATTVASYWYKYSDGTCGGPFTSTGYDYYKLGGEIPTTDLAQLTLSSPTNPGRLGQRFYQSTDGMRRPGPLHDAMLGADCYPSVYGEGSTAATCQPSATYAFYSHDAACSQPELAVTSTCPKPAYSVDYDPNRCPTQAPAYFTTGAQVASSPLYYQTGTACTAQTPSTTETYYTLGQPLTLAPMTLETDSVPSHRLQTLHYTTSDGLRVRDYTLYDTTKGADCYPATLPDGTIRCLAFGGYVDTYYTSAACTTQVDVAAVTSGPASCGSPTIPKYATKYITPPAGSCAYTREAHPITTPYSGPLYTNYGTCTLYTPTNVRMYNVGAALPLTDFMTATVLTDP